MKTVTLKWDDGKSEAVSVQKDVKVRAGANNSIILTIIDAENEIVDFYCDEADFEN